jgi:hypothetical protein
LILTSLVAGSLATRLPTSVASGCVDLTRHNPDSSVLVKSPEIAISSVNIRRAEVAEVGQETMP